jgi:hypothetical protein
MDRKIQVWNTELRKVEKTKFWKDCRVFKNNGEGNKENTNEYKNINYIT